jgi:hypothetical protein
MNRVCIHLDRYKQRPLPQNSLSAFLLGRACAVNDLAQLESSDECHWRVPSLVASPSAPFTTITSAATEQSMAVVSAAVRSGALPCALRPAGARRAPAAGTRRHGRHGRQLGATASDAGGGSDPAPRVHDAAAAEARALRRATRQATSGSHPCTSRELSRSERASQPAAPGGVRMVDKAVEERCVAFLPPCSRFKNQSCFGPASGAENPTRWRGRRTRMHSCGE